MDKKGNFSMSNMAWLLLGLIGFIMLLLVHKGFRDTLIDLIANVLFNIFYS